MVPTVFLTKNSQNTYLHHQNVEFGGPLKSPTRVKNELIFPVQPLNFKLKSIQIYF